MLRRIPDRTLSALFSLYSIPSSRLFLSEHSGEFKVRYTLLPDRDVLENPFRTTFDEERYLPEAL